jgi:hypothetical protein
MTEFVEMRWLCKLCQVEWSSTGEDHGPCWNQEPGEDHSDHIVETFEVPAWAMGYTHLQNLYRDREAS